MSISFSLSKTAAASALSLISLLPFFNKLDLDSDDFLLDDGGLRIFQQAIRSGQTAQQVPRL
jgi:hypothetical protein